MSDSINPTTPSGVVTLRSITPEDMPFLLEVYSSSRAEELTQTDWDDEQKAAFLKMQFEAQHAYYQENYKGTSFDVILIDGQPAGRLYVARLKDEIRIVDIALLQHWRSRGTGTALIKELFAEASAAGKPLRIHVEKFNPALRLYERLGFKAIADRGVYWFMEWRKESMKEEV
ncbi:MAG TPA: GNAT family N-acetyltransferase [Blastocatellia bacterium]|nr:GNAT family N-acetyltransferase [Blastocatellia bacterium]